MMEFKNCKLELNLICHAPIIHFQPDEEGTTLRASEVKPKFDRYLMKKVPNLKKRLKNLHSGLYRPESSPCF